MVVPSTTTALTNTTSNTNGIYSSEQIDALFHFIQLPTAVVGNTTKTLTSENNGTNNNQSNLLLFGSTAKTQVVEWWPCFVFSNMMELQMVTEQLGLWTTLPKNQILLQYMQHLPHSATCRVALLQSISTTSSVTTCHHKNNNNNDAMVLFDIPPTTTADTPTASSFCIEPFYDKALYYGALYSHNPMFLHAMKQFLPHIQKCVLSATTTVGTESFVSSSSSLPPETKETKAIATKTNETSSSANSNVQHQQDESYAATTGSIPTTVTVPREKINESETKTDLSRKHLASSDTNATSTMHQEKQQVKNTNTTNQGNNNDTDSSKSDTVTAPSTTKTIETKKSAEATKVPTQNSKTPSNNYEFVEIPEYNEVKPILIKGGYTLQPNKFCRPCLVVTGADDTMDVVVQAVVPTKKQCFATIAALRQDLCVYGVNCKCGSDEEYGACKCWTEDERWNIKLWVRYNIIRGPIHVSSPVHIISPHIALKYLIRLGYEHRTLQSSLTTSEQINDIFRYLSQYGLPTTDDNKYCDYSKLSIEERFALEYFISTNHFRVKTFTYTLPESIDNPVVLTKSIDSPIFASAVRPKRSIVRKSQNDTACKKLKMNSSSYEESGGATIVSIASQSSTIASQSPISTNESIFPASSRKNDAVNISTPMQTKSNKRVSNNIVDTSPILRKASKPLPKGGSKQHQRVSLSPLPPSINYEKEDIPVFDGSDHERLSSCLTAVQTAHKSNSPTICFDDEKHSKKSKFANNIRTVWNFAQAVFLSRGRHGRTSHNNEEASAALYVCGSPGLGKTSGVHWCCDSVSKLSDAEGYQMKVLHLNASYLTSQSAPMEVVMKKIGQCLGLQSHLQEGSILKHLRNPSKSVVLMIVIDEIDAFVSGQGRTNGATKCLKRLLQLANQPNTRLGLIGISNCMNDDKYSEISELGEFLESVMFSPYNEYEIQQILLARVGTSVVAPNVIEYIAKKVASTSGDARKALEMAANAIEHRLAQIVDVTTTSVDGHLVKMPNVVQANKEEVSNLKDRISGLPLVGKVILCVLTSYAQAGGAVDTTVGELKQCVSDCMRHTGMEDEMVQMDDFLVLLETLIDSGLLRASGGNGGGDRGNGMNLSRRTLSDVHRQPIRLGIQLDDIEKVLESDLKQTFYQKLRDHARVYRQQE